MIKLRRFNKDIGEYTKEVKINYDISLTSHAEERQSRHDEKDKKKHISDAEIMNNLKSANDKIVDAIINNNINVGTRDRFLIRNKKSGLNIVCGTHKGDEENSINVIVITCGRYGDEFRNQGGTFVIEI